jgi:hypothetical protein
MEHRLMKSKLSTKYFNLFFFNESSPRHRVKFIVRLWILLFSAALFVAPLELGLGLDEAFLEDMP